MPPAVEAHRVLNRWTSREFPPGLFTIKSDVFAIDFCETPFVSEEVSSLLKLCGRKACCILLKAFKIIKRFFPFNLLV